MRVNALIIDDFYSNPDDAIDRIADSKGIAECSTLAKVERDRDSGR